jgi:hypothetical protein
VQWNKNAPALVLVMGSRCRHSGLDLAVESDSIRARARIQVVGIVEDGKYTSLTEEPQPAMFFPILPSPSSQTYLVVRSDCDPQQLVPAIKKQLA